MRIRKLKKWMLEYWYDVEDSNHIIPLKIPYNVVIEMFCDMVSTSKTYGKRNWKCSDPFDYYLKNFVGKKKMHKETAWLLSTLLENLAEFTKLKEFFLWYEINKDGLKKAYEEAE